MTATFKPTLESFEDRCLPSASPLLATANVYVQDELALYRTTANLVASVEGQLHHFGVSSLTQLLHKPLTASQRNQVAGFQLQLKVAEIKLAGYDAKYHEGMVALSKLESTKYKAFDHTAFNHDVAVFNVYERAAIGKLSEMFTLN